MFANFTVGEIYLDIATSAKPLMERIYSSNTALGTHAECNIREEIHALVLFLAIARVLMATAAKVESADYESLSQKSAVLGLATYITRLFLESDGDFANDELRALLQRIVRNREPKRPQRSAPRVSVRPRARWDPSGRVGG